MSSILLSPISFTSPRLARRYLREVYTSNNDVLEFARGKHGLTVWEWPLDSSNELIATDALNGYCDALNVPRPGCLCPLKDLSQPCSLEASINVAAVPGPHCGEYIAQCSTKSCGYFVPLRQIYLNKITKIYEKQEDAPTPHSMLSEQMLPRNRLKCSYALSDMTSEAYTIPSLTPSSRQATDTEMLLKLDDYNQPGLYDNEFRALLTRMVRCSCRMVMLRRVFGEHRCNLAPMQPLKRRRLSSDKTEGGSQTEEE